MLAAIIQNLQNQPQPEARPPTIHVDRGGGGPSWPRYEIVDIIAAIAAFREVPDEHPVARAARRHRWIGEALPGIKDAREKREAAAFLAGATLADAAADERHAAMDQLKIEKIVEIIDEIRAESREQAPPPSPSMIPSRRCSEIERLERGAYDGPSGGLALGLFVGGLALGVILARRTGSSRQKHV